MPVLGGFFGKIWEAFLFKEQRKNFKWEKPCNSNNVDILGYLINALLCLG